jgi:hypothetical protein
MRSIEEVQRVLALIGEGLNDCEIARRTQIPRGTIRDWRRGRIPGRKHRARSASAPLSDKSCPRCGHPEHDFTALPGEAYAYLLGLYLGDGTISRAHRGVYKLRIILDARYPGIIEECGSAMAAACPASKVMQASRVGCIEVYSYSRAWPCLFPQHGPGRKHEREIRLAEWQCEIVNRLPRPLLRGLIHSDGCHSVNTIKHPKKTYIYPRYLFSNRSADIRWIFCDACDREDIEWRVMTETDISIARCESVALMDEFIGPKK